MQFMASEQTARQARTATAIRFPEELHERLRAAADDYGLPLNYLVVKVMQEFLDNMVPPNELRFMRPPRDDAAVG
jgi:predicted HicB family RNase H-like nuclease